MLVDFPYFGAGIHYFPNEISALKVFEPRYLLLIADCIKNDTTFTVGVDLNTENQIISEVRIIEYQDIDNAEQLVITQCLKNYKLKNFNFENEYPKIESFEHNDIGLPPEISELESLEKKIINATAKLIENGINLEIPKFNIDSYNRFNKFYELCVMSPINPEIKHYILEEKVLEKKFEILNRYIDKILSI